MPRFCASPIFSTNPSRLSSFISAFVSSLSFSCAPAAARGLKQNAATTSATSSRNESDMAQLRQGGVRVRIDSQLSPSDGRIESSLVNPFASRHCERQQIPPAGRDLAPHPKLHPHQTAPTARFTYLAAKRLGGRVLRGKTRLRNEHMSGTPNFSARISRRVIQICERIFLRSRPQPPLPKWTKLVQPPKLP